MVYYEVLQEFLKAHGVVHGVSIPSGLPVWVAEYPLAAVRTEGAVLFADLPSFSEKSVDLDPVETAVLASHFFALFEETTARLDYGGIVDKFIGDALMMVFLRTETKKVSPLEAAMRTAHRVLDFDPFGIRPRIGIAHGPLAIAMVGTMSVNAVTAMGHTVNLAARCKADEMASVKIATNDLDLVRNIFSDVENWKITLDPAFKPKNMPVTPSVTVVRTSTTRLPDFDLIDFLKEQIRQATHKVKGAVGSA